jgi:hypothetical protein
MVDQDLTAAVGQAMAAPAAGGLTGAAAVGPRSAVIAFQDLTAVVERRPKGCWQHSTRTARWGWMIGPSPVLRFVIPGPAPARRSRLEPW